MFSIIIPVYNEEKTIGKTIQSVHEAMVENGEDFEIIVIDDGSIDETSSILSGIHINNFRVITHEQNRGNGAAIKTGVRNAKGNVIGTIDADSTYPAGDYPRFISHMRKKRADMMVGARTKKGVKIQWNRRPAKAIVALLAGILTGQRIPDINSGMRIFTRELFERFEHLYPQGFSLHITITLAALTHNYNVIFEPIDYYKREGSSSMSSGMNGVKNFISFLGLIVRITTYFRPLRFFMWPASIIFFTGIGIMAYTIFTDLNITEAGLLLVVVGIQIGLFGLLAEVLTRHRLY